MTLQYSLSDNLTPAQFEELQLSGDINPNATYQDYLELHQERVARKCEAEEAARRNGYELGAPELDLSPEDEEILDRVCERICVEKAAARERGRLPRVA